jgi:PAS domain S-box-containing protein
MQDKDKTKEQLIKEMAVLRQQIAELKIPENERKRNEHALHANESLYKNLIDLLPAVVFELDERSNIKFANRQGFETFGYTPEELEKGLSVLQLVVPEERNKVEQNIRKIIKGKKIINNEYTALRKNGSTFPVIVYSTPILVDNRAVGLRGIVVDVTENKQVEETLRASEEKFRTFMETASDLMSITDKDLKLTYVNDSMAMTLGYTKQEMVGIHISRFLRKEDVEKDFKQKTEELIAKGKFNLETTWLAKDGKEIHGELSVVAVYDNAGTFAGTRGVFHDLTEWYQAQQALWQSKERFRSLVEVTSDWIWEVDQNGVYTYASPKVKGLLGYEPEEVTGKRPCDLMPPDEAERVGTLFRDTLIFQGHLERLEHVTRHRNGRQVVLETSGIPICDEQGHVLGFRGIARDVTERKQVEKKLRIKESAIASSINAIAMADLEGNLTYVNPSFLRMWGYEQEEEVVERSAFEFWQNAEKALQIIEEVREKRNWIGELGAKRKDGSEFYVQLSANMVTDEIGNPLCMMGSFVDITAHKQMERELCESRLRYRTLFENAPVGIGLATIDGRILAGNQAMHQMTGYSEADMGKIHVRDLYVNPKDSKLLLRQLLRGEPVREFEASLKRKDGTLFDASLTINRITLGGEDILLTMIRDITARKEAERRLLDDQQQLRSLATQLSLAEERGRRRIATSLHDQIGHSMAMCKIKMGLLRESLPPKHRNGYVDEIKEILEQVIQHTRSLTSDLSPPVLYELGLTQALEWLAENVSKQHGIQVAVKKSGQLEKLNPNIQILLFQTVRELLTNIVKHAQAQKGEIYIRRDKNNKMRIEVKDDGVGFDTSYLLSNIVRNGGFGLFNIRERFNHLGGHCDIQSQPGCGTRVTIIVSPETMEQ